MQKAQGRANLRRGRLRAPSFALESISAVYIFAGCIRGISSDGRAPALHAGGRRFDPGMLHGKRPPGNGWSFFMYGRGLEPAKPVIRICYFKQIRSETVR